MGRPQQRERERKKAANTCERLDNFFLPCPVAKKRKTCSADDGLQPQAAQDKEMSVEIDGNDADLENTCMPVMQEKVRTVVSLHPRHSDEDEDHQVCEAEEALATVTEINADDGALTATFGSSPTSTSRQARSAVLQHPTTSTVLGTTVELLHTTANDIGSIVTASQSTMEIAEKIQKLLPGEKYALLKHHTVPSGTHTFPTTFLAGCNRSFKIGWLKEYPWMVYSQIMDGIFCIACSLFCTTRITKGDFVNRPFRKWHHKSKCKTHQQAHYHQEAMQLADDFSMSVQKPELTTVTALIDKTKVANIERNRIILKAVAEAILLCGRQCIALRGDNESLKEDNSGNIGKFLSILKLISKYNETLASHLKKPAMKCVTYLSPQTQNELLDVIGKHIILRDIVKEIKEAHFYSICADEVTSHNTEQLAICVRFVDVGGNIREEFLTFVKLARITGAHIAQEILGVLEELDIPVENMRGQGYDGASNMSSEVVGVQTRIREKSPLATYIHCSGHCLNLVISHSCTLPEVRNMLDKLKNCSLFFQHSPKRNNLLQHIVNSKLKDHPTKRKALLQLCKTRWAERHNAYQHFYQAYTFIVEALEMIGQGQHIEEHGTLFSDWDADNRSAAQQILSSITTFEFILVFLLAYQYLSHLSGVTIQLQSSTLDIIEAHGMIKSIKDVYQLERENMKGGFKAIYDHAVRMADQVGVIPSMPRIAKRQQHRSNAPAESPFDYYNRNVAIPFLDHISSNLNTQFSVMAVTASSLLGLVPAIICAREIDIEDALKMYSNDLPSPELVPQEIKHWKLRYEKMPEDKRPASVASAIKECDPMYFPNLRTLLQIACTLPVTSCECERSASTLRRLHNYMRASMGQERMTALALMHIHYDSDIDLNEVVNIYAQMHPRRMELEYLVKP